MNHHISRYIGFYQKMHIFHHCLDALKLSTSASKIDLDSRNLNALFQFKNIQINLFIMILVILYIH